METHLYGQTTWLKLLFLAKNGSWSSATSGSRYETAIATSKPSLSSKRGLCARLLLNSGQERKTWPCKFLVSTTKRRYFKNGPILTVLQQGVLEAFAPIKWTGSRVWEFLVVLPGKLRFATLQSTNSKLSRDRDIKFCSIPTVQSHTTGWDTYSALCNDCYIYYVGKINTLAWRDVMKSSCCLATFWKKPLAM